MIVSFLYVTLAIAVTSAQVGQLGQPKLTAQKLGITQKILNPASIAIETDTVEQKCPKNWVSYRFACYKFKRSPVKSRYQAKAQCQAYGAELVSISNKLEHGFLTRYLHENDPLHRTWYTSGIQKNPGYWENEADGSSYQDLMEAILPNQGSTPNRNYLAYQYSNRYKEWGLLMVDGEEELQYICEIPQKNLDELIDEEEERDHEFGKIIGDLEKVPRAPVIINQPKEGMFDLARRSVINYVSMSCMADGFPYPTYEWYKELYENDTIISKVVDPLKDSRFTVSGGTLIINDPKQVGDRGKYHCIARNEFGSVNSESVALSFAYVAEFNLKRSDELGNQYWGKAVYCDPPQYFPDVQYYWARNYFPNFVEEDRRTMVSFDGNLYFSYLDFIDVGKYSCNVQSTVSNIGKNGPFFNLQVFPHPNYQQLKFANNFPKAFPESPIRGEDVRLECIAFGYPVPSYNWTRKDGSLPRGSQLQNYNRVLILPKVEPADMGIYICRAQNERLSVENSISLSIQAKPSFTIPLMDQFIAKGADLIWECESFGIPDVEYEWLRNSELLVIEYLDATERERYEIQDNVLKIKAVVEDDEAVYQCKATNQLGSAFSSAQLSVLSLAPTFQKKPLEPEIFASEGMNVTIVCNPEAAPKPNFIWRKDGLVLGRGGRRNILRNGNLLISPVAIEDQGNYSCTAKNEFGEESSSGILIVLSRPEFYLSPPEEITAAAWENITLECEAYTDEILDTAYIWRHNGLRIELDDTEYLENQAYELGYDYEKKIRAGYDQVRENILFTRQYEKRYLDDYASRREPPYQRGLRAGHLRIVNLTLTDAGLYECVAMTPVARIAIHSTLTIIGPPGPPGGVVGVDLTSTAARIQWTDGASNGRPIERYSIQARTHWDKKWKVVADYITATVIDNLNGRKEYQLEDGSLSPWSSFEFRIQAINELGRGEYSAPSPQANSRQDRPFTVPKNLGGGGGKTGDLLFTWDPLPGEEQNAPGIYYKLFWRRVEIDPELQFQTLVLRERGNANMHVVDVDPIKYFFCGYEVKIQAWNSMGPGPIGEPVIVKTAEDMPQVQPTAVSAFAHNATSLNVTWQPITPSRENIRGDLIGYRIKYWRRQDAETDHLIKLELGIVPHALVLGLVPNTFYWVRVMAYNKAGSGPESERFLERTWRYPPLMPPNAVQVFAVDPSTIRVTWRGVTPTAMEEPLYGYKIKTWESDQDYTKARDTLVPIGSQLDAYVTDLAPGKTYKLRVLAYSRGGDGKLSSPPWEFQLGDTDVLRGEASIPHPLLESTLMVTFLVAFLAPLLRWKLFPSGSPH